MPKPKASCLVMQRFLSYPQYRHYTISLFGNASVGQGHGTAWSNAGDGTALSPPFGRPPQVRLVVPQNVGQKEHVDQADEPFAKLSGDHGWSSHLIRAAPAMYAKSARFRCSGRARDRRRHRAMDETKAPGVPSMRPSLPILSDIFNSLILFTASAWSAGDN